MSNLFDDTNVDTPDQDDNKDYLAEFVGEGKKYKDAQALAKAYQHASTHISLVEREAAEKDAELSKRLTYEDLLKKIKEPASSEIPPGLNERTSEVDVVSKVEEILDRKLTAYEKKSIAKQNVDFVRQELTKVWGNATPRRLKEKAIELEVSEDFLASIAESNPKAFLKLVSPERNAVEVNAPRSSIRVSEDRREFKPYSEYKKMMLSTDSKIRNEYWSAKVQNEMHELTAKFGEDFLNK